MAARMARREYRMIAQAIADTRAERLVGVDLGDAADELVEATLDSLVTRLADEFEKDNPYFSRGIFLAAAGRR